MKLLVISGNYPSLKEPQKGIFVYKLIQEFASIGIRVLVISPTKLFLFKKNIVESYGEEKAFVLRPRILSLSSYKIFGFNTIQINRWSTIYAIRSIARKRTYDRIYCHFLVNALIATKVYFNSDIKIYAAVGENKGIDSLRSIYSEKEYDKLIKRINGFIAVSPIIKEKLLSLGIDENRIFLSPNAVDHSTFYPVEDKQSIRKSLHLPQDKKIVIFVGRFIDSKGPIRVLKALEALNDEVVGIFIGAGPQIFYSDKIVFKGIVKHDVVAEYLRASDVFVLPTLHEGSCNSINEAMACGLPIVSSDIPEIRFQCKPDFSVLVNPLNSVEIADAISNIIYSENTLNRMKLAAINNSKKLTIRQRAEDISHFISKD